MSLVRIFEEILVPSWGLFKWFYMSPSESEAQFLNCWHRDQGPRAFLTFYPLRTMFSMIISKIGNLRKKAGFLHMLDIPTFGTLVNTWICLIQSYKKRPPKDLPICDQAICLMAVIAGMIYWVPSWHQAHGHIIPNAVMVFTSSQ